MEDFLHRSGKNFESSENFIPGKHTKRATASINHSQGLIELAQILKKFKKSTTKSMKNFPTQVSRLELKFNSIDETDHDSQLAKGRHQIKEKFKVVA
jgi:hypothetical protein